MILNHIAMADQVLCGLCILLCKKPPTCINIMILSNLSMGIDCYCLQDGAAWSVRSSSMAMVRLGIILLILPINWKSWLLWPSLLLQRIEEGSLP